MPLIIVLVAVAAAVGLALVMYGIVSRERAVAAADTGRSARVTYRTLADVREQLRRRFEPTGTPVWIAANQNINALAADLASADLQLRPYEFRLLQGAVALGFALIAFMRFGFNIAVPVLAVIGYVLPALAPWCLLLSLGVARHPRGLRVTLALSALASLAPPRQDGCECSAPPLRSSFS